MTTPSPEFEIKNFGELKAGDVLVGPRGEDVSVKTVYDAHVPERMYEIELEDGTTIEASGNHLWYIEPDSDIWEHSSRLKKARSLLNANHKWVEEALEVAKSDTHYEIGLEDLMEFFDFIDDYNERYYFLLRIAESIGHIVEEEVAYQDFATGEQTNPSFEKVYDARRFFQQALALSGKRSYRKKWPIVVGRVVTTDVIFNLYPDVDIPTVQKS